MTVFAVNQSEEDPAQAAVLCSGPRTGDPLTGKEDGRGAAAQHSVVAFCLPYRKVEATDCS